MYDYIFFDLDGTLTRSGEGIKKSAAHAIAQLGYPALTEAQLDSFVGPPLLESFRTLCGMDEETALRAVAIYRARFEEVGWLENAVYPGIAPLLRALRAAGKHVSIVTAKPERFAVRIAEYFGMAPYLDAIVGIAMDEHHADKAALIARALPAGADRARAVMVGDRKFDVLGAKEAGISSLAVGYGYGTRKELDACAPDMFASTVSELFGLLGVSRPRGRFFTFEGTDGCGKSTQMALLGDRLTSRGWEVICTREPGGCAISEDIRRIILDTANTDMCPACEALLYAAARAQHVSQVIRPAVERGMLVLCDRFVDSSVAYQGGGRGLGVETVQQINDPAVDGMTPDATLYLAIDHRAALRRRLNASEPDRLELEAGEFHERVQKAYERLVRDNRRRFVVVDAARGVDEVARDALDAVLERLLPDRRA